MDTAVLSGAITAVRSGRYNSETYGDRNILGHFLLSATGSTSYVGVASFRSGYITGLEGHLRNWGMNVRCGIPSTFLLSGSYGLAEGTGTNAGTSVLTIGYVLSGIFYRTGLYGRDWNHYWGRALNGTEEAHQLVIRVGSLSPVANQTKGSGAVVRKSVSNLISGSYGLAEGNSTNVSTAVLTIGFVQSKNTGQGFGFTWGAGHTFLTTTRQTDNRNLMYLDNTLSTGTWVERGRGVGVR